MSHFHKTSKTLHFKVICSLFVFNNVLYFGFFLTNSIKPPLKQTQVVHKPHKCEEILQFIYNHTVYLSTFSIYFTCLWNPFGIVPSIWFTICSRRSAKERQRPAVSKLNGFWNGNRCQPTVASFPFTQVTACGCKDTTCSSTQHIVQGVRVGGLSDSNADWLSLTGKCTRIKESFVRFQRKQKTEKWNPYWHMDLLDSSSTFFDPQYFFHQMETIILPFYVLQSE